LAVLVLSAFLTSTAPAAVSPQFGSWSKLEQRITMREGLLRKFKDGKFHGERRLTAGQLAQVRDSLANRYARQPVPLRRYRGKVTIRQFHDLVVRQLGFGPEARHVQKEAWRAGLRPNRWFGTEVVARLIELRHNQDEKYDRNELYPWDPITRAEVAWSLAEVVETRESEFTWIHRWLARFNLPRYNAAQKRVLRRAVSLTGMPFVWGGTRDRAGGGQVHGGYDCSGFLTRVFVHSGDPAGRKIRARTAVGMAREANPRIRLKNVRAGDLVFFARWPRPIRRYGSLIHHSGIAMSKDWVISATHQGVNVYPLFDDWLWEEFAWGRRIL
jgi:cell wall-associated NlpC family hydrolase